MTFAIAAVRLALAFFAGLSAVSFGALTMMVTQENVTAHQVTLSVVEMVTVVIVTASAAWTAAWWLAKRDRKIDALERRVEELLKGRGE